MGSPSNEGCRKNNEGPVHLVTITRPFFMKQTEVTQGEWKAIYGTNPSHADLCGDDCPVENVNWYAAVDYANRLSLEDGFNQCYTLYGCNGTPGTASFNCSSASFAGLRCNGYRLPTEAEWEHATRAGTTTAYWIGSNIGSNGLPVCNNGDPSGTGLPEIAWYAYSSGNESHPVGQKLPNQWGLYDVHGSVAEWVYDFYSATYYDYCAQGCTDPIGFQGGTTRVYRGGWFIAHADKLRSAARLDAAPSYSAYMIGLRLARSLP